MNAYVKTIQATLVLAFTLIVSIQTKAADPINTSFWGNKVIDGYDPVVYHLQKKATLGSKKYTFEWKGAQWLFSSAKNRALFQKEPLKYAPQYGGYCAWAAAQGKLADTDPKLFDFYEGKLYLNYNHKTRLDWRLDKKNMVEKGNKLFPSLIK
ncbi:MAG: YHS domain protein [Verrucomicrobia bacterium]|jgi:hypothetical protein|nr:YHS domain protein [Verrucomicrobiota bacterium]